uniref:Transmembrane protein n=1 Tax=Romanomermis culicivorax TaxID=13658 RepID=A0A915IWJ8_ROMCU
MEEAHEGGPETEEVLDLDQDPDLWEALDSERGGPWEAKRVRGASVPSVGQYHAITLTSPVIFSIVGGFTLTGVAYFSWGSKADNRVGAKTTAVAKLKIQYSLHRQDNTIVKYPPGVQPELHHPDQTDLGDEDRR